MAMTARRRRNKDLVVFIVYNKNVLFCFDTQIQFDRLLFGYLFMKLCDYSVICDKRSVTPKIRVSFS